MKTAATTVRSTPQSTGLAERAYVTLRRRIIRGEFAVGQVISRRRIAAELGISFLPASEALLRLQCDGLLETRARAGTRIRIPTRHDVQGHFVVREALEVQAAMMFAANATSEERAGIRKLAARLDARSARYDGNPFLYAWLHEKLHLKIAEGARCDALCDSIRRTSALSFAWRGAMKGLMPASLPESHEDLIGILTTGDPASAAEAMRSHVRSGTAWMMQILEPQFQFYQEYKRTYSRTIRQPPQDEHSSHQKSKGAGF